MREVHPAVLVIIVIVLVAAGIASLKAQGPDPYVQTVHRDGHTVQLLPHCSQSQDREKLHPAQLDRRYDDCVGPESADVIAHHRRLLERADKGEIEVAFRCGPYGSAGGLLFVYPAPEGQGSPIGAAWGLIPEEAMGRRPSVLDSTGVAA